VGLRGVLGQLEPISESPSCEESRKFSSSFLQVSAAGLLLEVWIFDVSWSLRKPAADLARVALDIMAGAIEIE